MPEPRVSYELSEAQRLYLVPVGILIGLSQLLNGNEVFAAILMALFVVAFFVQGQFGTDLSDEGIRVRNGLRGSKSIAWNEIAEIEESRILGTRTVRAILADGSKVRFPAPVDAFFTRDSEFDSKLERVRREWRSAAARP